MDASLPVVAVVGRPNVGKSSLVNRILGRREAIVEATPGVTRDRSTFTAHWAGRDFELVDTGGLERGSQGLEARAAEQAQLAMAAADVIVFVVDAVSGPMEDDHVVADALRRSPTPVIVVANKVDDEGVEPGAAAFFRLGLGPPFPVSALHGRGSGDLLDAIAQRLPTPHESVPGAWAAAAIVGRPNVGKSSLLNAFLGEERALVHELPGTTRDPVDSVVELAGDRRLTILDTAGMRRRVQIDEPLEYFSWLRARRTLTRVDVALLVIDGAAGVTALDQRLAQEVVDHGRACVVVVNKWDLVPGDEAARAIADVTHRLRFMPWAPVVRASAKTGRNVARALDAVAVAVESFRRRLPTAEVNRVFGDAQTARAPARSRGRTPRVLYAAQTSVSPPRMVLFTTGALERSYLRYLERRLRDHEPFVGTPVVFDVRRRSRDQLDGY